MNLTRLLIRIGNIACALVVAAVVFVIALAAGVALAAWFVNQSAPTTAHPPLRPTQLRHYALPLAGFATAFWVLLRCALSAVRRAAQVIASGGIVNTAARQAGFAIVWTIAATAVFMLAGGFQRKFYGFFLP